MHWRVERESLRKENRELESRNRELESEKKENEKNLLGQKKLQRRTLLVTLAGVAFTGVCAAVAAADFWRKMFPAPLLTITPKVYSPYPRDSKSDVIVPGGVKFTIRNSGTRSAVFIAARIAIDDYERFQACTYGSGPVDPGVCYGVSLPVDATPGVEIEVPLSYEVTTDESGSFNLAFDLEDGGSEAALGAIGLDIHIYRVRIALVQDDGSTTEQGPFVIVAPRDHPFMLYWKADRVLHGDGGDSANWQTLEEATRSSTGSEGELWKALECFNHNDEALRRIITDDSLMSENMESVRHAMQSGFSTDYLSSAPDPTSDPSLYVCPKK